MRELTKWSLALALPAQYCVVLVLQLVELATVGIPNDHGPGLWFGCRSSHEEGLFSCTFTGLLTNVLWEVLVFNVTSFGGAFVVSASLIAVLLAFARWLSRRIQPGPPTEVS